jgi:hypothetical protein
MNLRVSPNRFVGRFALALVAAVLPACTLAVEAGEEVSEIQEATPTAKSVREARINEKFNANQSLLIAPSGNFQHFETGFTGARRDYQGAGNNSSIYWCDQLAQANIVMGLIRGKYLALGAQAGAYLYPTTDEHPTLYGTGRYNNFQGGRILWKNGQSQAFGLLNAVLGVYSSLGNEWGLLGYPTANQENVLGIWTKFKMDFGFLFWRSDTRPWAVLSSSTLLHKLGEQGAPRIDSARFVRNSAQRLCVNMSGVSFPPGRTLEFYINDPASSRLMGGTATVNSSGSFGFTQPSSFCLTDAQIAKVNGFATLEAFVPSTGARAIAAVATTAGGTFSGPPLN